ncbi:MAG TPA: SIMPL domain-containing protein [bacterium]|nr:SIMPL domain-containing protein [bacterium]
MNKQIWVIALIMGASLLASAGLVSQTIYKTKLLDNTLTVTGSAKKTVKADLGKISGSFSRTVAVNDLPKGYGQMAADLKTVKDFFASQGVAEKDLVISPVFMDQQYNYEKSADAPQMYSLRQNVELQLKDVEKITALAQSVQELIGKGVIFSTQSPEYYYTNLPQVRVDLLGEAVSDARARADRIASSGGRGVNSLRSASVGVTQVTSPNSIDSISDYGSYDTSKIDKEVMITVKTVFALR